jgi:DNA-directed RNA polymerase specialized sigma subunit
MIRRNLAHVGKQKDFLEVPYDKSGIPFRVCNNNTNWLRSIFSLYKEKKIDDSFVQPVNTPEHKTIINILDVKYKKQILEDYIIDMSVVEQKMLYLKYTVWLSYNEIAMILEISKDMVSYKITSLYKEIKTYVDSLYNNDRSHW